MALNKWQQAVIDAKAKGPQTIEAVPGSGKTRTLETLVATLINDGVNPSKIGVFTFARKAASEARRRIAKSIFPEITEKELAWFEDPSEDNANLDDDVKIDRAWVDADPKRKFLVDWVCTIHALSFRLLKSAGYKLKVVSGHHQWEVDSIIKDGIKEFDWDESPKSVKYWIAKAITNLIEPEYSRVWFSQQLDNLGGPVWAAKHLAELYRRYREYLTVHDLIDFDLMQARCVYLLRNKASFRDMVGGLFDYILVDEAQDTSPQQSEILWALAAKTGNILYCGDVDQAMYKFRGAEPKVLREDFEVKWPNTQRFILPMNYRSTKAIINACSNLIHKNYYDDKYLKPFDSRDDAPDGKLLSYTEAASFNELTDEVASTVMSNGEPQEWFVLSRTRAECAAIHTALLTKGIPSVNHSGGLLFGSPHVRKVLAYARLACSYKDARNNVEILKEIANVASKDFRAPMSKHRHIGNCNVKPWQDCSCPLIMQEGVDYSHARYYGQKAIEEARNWNGIEFQQWEKNRGGYPSLNSKGAKDLVSFVTRLETTKDNCHITLKTIIDDSILPWLKAEEGISDEDLAENGKVEDFDLLLNMTTGEDGNPLTMEAYLEKVDLLSTGGTKVDTGKAVHIGTFHWSKGAENKYVIVNTTRCPIIPPRQREGMLPVGLPPTIEEERRLCYVGTSRAKEECYIITSKEWNEKDIERSQFVEELGLA